jgi:hypothetical protein
MMKPRAPSRRIRFTDDIWKIFDTSSRSTNNFFKEFEHFFGSAMKNSNLINAYSYESMLLFASKTRMNDIYEISRSIIRINATVLGFHENYFFFVITER